MAFDTQTVTIKGAELLAAATAANQLIIDGCDATTGYMTQAQAVNISTRPASPVSNTTDVTQLGSTAEHINSRVYFRTGVNAGGDVNTLFLYGHSASTPNDKFVIFVASSQTPFHLPVAGDVIDEWECALDIVYTINTDSVGFATQATYCSLSEFNLLKERTVTTHKEGLATTGEDQTIYGNKYFKDITTHENDVYFESEDDPYGIRFGVSGAELSILPYAIRGGTLAITSSRVVFSGALDSLFVDGYALHSGEIAFVNESTSHNVSVFVNNSADTVSDANIVDIQNVRNATISNMLTINGSNVDPDGYVTLQQIQYPGDNNTTEIWLRVEWPDASADRTVFYVSGDIKCTGTIEINGGNFYCNEVGSEADLYDVVIDGSLSVSGASTFNGAASFNGNVTVDLGLTSNDVITSLSTLVVKDDSVRVFDSSDHLKTELSTSGLNVSNSSGVTTGVLNADTGNLAISGKMTVGNGLVGVASYKDNSNNLVVPVGGIVLAYIGKQSTAITKYAGEIIQTTDFNPVPKVGYIRDDGSLTSGGVPNQMGSVDSNLPSGKYACLSTIQATAAQGCLALLQRVE
jgi:hypothetical protein